MPVDVFPEIIPVNETSLLFEHKIWSIPASTNWGKIGQGLWPSEGAPSVIKIVLWSQQKNW